MTKCERIIAIIEGMIHDNSKVIQDTCTSNEVMSATEFTNIRFLQAKNDQLYKVLLKYEQMEDEE